MKVSDQGAGPSRVDVVDGKESRGAYLAGGEVFHILKGEICAEL